MVRAVCAYWLMSSVGLNAAAQVQKASATLNADMRQTGLRRVFTKTCYRIAFRPDLPVRSNSRSLGAPIL